MLRLLSLILFTIVANHSMAHKFYFAFAEVEYNEINKSLEATLIASAHDMESVLRDTKVISNTLENSKKNKKEFYAINDFLNNNFSFYITDSLSFTALDSSMPPQIQFILDGFEVMMNGDVQFYLSANISSNIDQIYVKFDLLMEKFSEQQNKLTFRFRDKKFTYNFLTTTKIQLIKIEQ